MKKSNIIKITILATFLVASIAVPIILYLTLDTNSSTNNNTKKNDLSNQSIVYLAKVKRMKIITEQEASQIKSDIKTKTNLQLNKLNLQENIDYKINSLEDIKEGINLDRLLIRVTSIETSLKAIGNFIIKINVQENINDRTPTPIKISNDEAIEGLSEIRARAILNTIILNVDSILNEGQLNIKDHDYEIINLNLIIPGAKFDDYNTKISVRGISEQIEGSFVIIFTIDPEMT